MEEAIRAWLLDTAALKASLDRRIDWGVRKQGAPLPSIALHLITGIPQMKLAGPTGWSRARVQIDCWGRTHKTAKDIRDVLGGPGGLLVGTRRDLPGLRLRTFVISHGSRTDSDSVGPLHCASLDAMIWHTPLPGGTP